MRYLLATAGLVAAAILATIVWIIIPHPQSLPVGSSTAQAQQAPTTELGASDSGDGEFRVCNETSNKVSIAFGYRAEKGWQSEGWWVADPAACVSVYHGDLDSRRYYYVYAADDVSGGAWDGDVYMCTRDETFTIFGVEDCLARGYERTGFFEVDTNNKSNWTLQLTEGEVVSAEGAAGEDEVPLEGDMSGDGGDDQSDDSNSPDEGTPPQ